MDSKRSPPHYGGNNLIRAAIVAVVVVVSIGYLMLWVVMPTNTFGLHWLPELRAKTASTYFGTNQGATYLVFTFPILFIAVLGCVYLHLGNKSMDNYTQGGNGEYHAGLAIWKRPVIMKGLGIVSGIELAFFLMFIALLIWNFATYLHVASEARHGGAPPWTGGEHRAVIPLLPGDTWLLCAASVWADLGG
ncbi:ferric reduction oxidase 2 [Phtheirospermum japonicum]|uniref:Ferric reduction oxidase 2 n=1 Tax=Phtheirospermum japonicum TaxID=374723 RepID=A0A830BVL1_9LAMI|nr:ferric reduction oxidase 2 [Phtheirospermum japonicum]